MSSIKRYVSAVLFAAALVIPTGAFGDSGSPSEHSLLMLVNSDSGTERIVAGEISKRIEDIGVSVKPTQVDGTFSNTISRINAARASGENAGAIGCFVLVESGEDTRFHLVMFDEKNEWSMVRRLDDLDTETLIETLALIVRTSLTVFMTDFEKQVEEAKRHPPSAPPPKPPEHSETAVPSPSVSFYRVEIGAGYDFSMIAKELSPVHGVRLEGELALNPLVNLYAGYVVSFPLKQEGESNYLRTVFHPAEVGVTFRIAWSRFILKGRTAFGINYIINEHRAYRRGETLFEQRGYLQLSIVPMLEFELSIIEQLGVSIAAGGDILLRRPRYLYKKDDTVEVIADPWPLAPKISVSVSWRLFKTER